MADRSRPGKMVSHGAASRYPWEPWDPSRSMPPRVGFGGGTPRPRKLRLDSVTMAVPRYPVARTKTGARELGVTWRSMMRTRLAPMAWAARTYTSSLMERVEERERRIMRGIRTTPMARVTLLRDAPSPTTSASARTSDGKPMKASTSRWARRSTHPPTYPEAMPMVVPMRVPKTTERSPT
jgi:hypothetical protein